MEVSRLLMEVYRTLRDAFGHRGWWPAETPFEVMVGAVLTQNTNWSNVEKAIVNLKSAGLMTPAALAAADSQLVESLIRPSGYYRQKAARLHRLTAWLVRRGGDCAALADVATDDLRAELLAIPGIGPETADSILLYALGRPVFVVDAYTKRMAVRHALVAEDGGYAELQGVFEDALPRDVDLFMDFHAQLVELGKRFCRPLPRCGECPLHSQLGDPACREGS